MPPESYKAGLPASILGHGGVESHALAPVTRPPVLAPGPGPVLVPAQHSPGLAPAVFRRPTLGGPIVTNHLPAPLAGPQSSIPSIRGPLLTPPFNKLDKLRLPRENTHPAPSGQCGVTPAFGETRILGGTEARLGQFPWVGYLSIKDQNIDKMCGASLISTRHVLTAGHCVDYCSMRRDVACEGPATPDLKMKVFLGEHNHNVKLKHLPLQVYHVTKVELHPNFTNAMTLRENGYLETEPRHDVAVLRLDREVKVSAHVMPICLPDRPVDLTRGLVGVVTGWGRTGVSASAPMSASLQAVKVPVLPPGLCAGQPGSTRPLPDQLCAGRSQSGRTACPGDSGGGLAVRNFTSGSWNILGIVSSGPVECGLTPVLYHNINTSLGWIRSVIFNAGA